MPLDVPTSLPPVGPQTEPDKVRVAVVVGGQMASAPARGIGLTAEELAMVQVLAAEDPASLVATAQTRNRVINGAFQISQEVAGAAQTANGMYAVDQWALFFAGTVAVNYQQVASVTPNGSKYRYRLTIMTADAALAAGDYLFTIMKIEGNRVADFRYGSASAKQSILRFGWKSPAGTYSVAIRNSAVNRSYVANFTIAAGQANIDTEQIIIIPGDTTGTWLTDTGTGIEINFVMAAGATSQGAAGWGTGSMATAANSNGMAIAGNIFEIFDVGLYLDFDNTGKAPAWQMPDEAEELRACQRYWSRTKATCVTAGAGPTGFFPVPMRVIPAVTNTPDGGTGAVFVALYPTSFYQTTVNSTANAAVINANARM